MKKKIFLTFHYSMILLLFYFIIHINIDIIIDIIYLYIILLKTIQIFNQMINYNYIIFNSI
ncbi:hypothetical protein H8356DRAFT_1624152 [Neocallimastix lanati (nom. inval.)]|nr:hypothetical protein H8356DRAFT_1624152 [Neocallimastix sp. JGI-2020a]